MAAMGEPSYIVASDSEVTGEESHSTFTGDAAVGIDLGSSHCAIALWRDSQLDLLTNPRGLRRMPTHVLFKEEMTCSGVTVSVSDVDLASGATIFNVKSLVGRMDNDSVVHNLEDSPFLVQSLDIGVRPFLAALVNGIWRSTTPEEVIAIILVELRAMAEAQLGRVVRSAVLTMPASFSRFEQTRLERACAMAGLYVLRLMPEPTAVALVYAQQQQQGSQGDLGSGLERNALIFNMGACFCDAAIAATAGGVSQIKALAGESFGGEDLLQNLIKHVLNVAIEKGLEINHRKLVAQFRPSIEKAMHALSFSHSTVIEGEVGVHKISKTLTREEFERVNEEIFSKCEALATQCIKQAQMDASNLADVILVGGCSRIPKLRTLIQNVCGGKQIYEGIHPIEAAVQGAALEGAIASGLTDLSGKLDLLTIQAMPHSLGIMLGGDEFFPILQKNTTIPARRNMSVTTSHDNQSEALLVVYEGEAKQASANHLLGFFKITGIPLAPKGVPLISVCMDVDASDVLRVVAGVCMPNEEKSSIPFIEVRMPTVDDGHGWCTNAIASKFGSLLEVASLPK